MTGPFAMLDITRAETMSRPPDVSPKTADGTVSSKSVQRPSGVFFVTADCPLSTTEIH